MLEGRSLSSNCLTEISHLEVPLSLNQAAGIPIILSPGQALLGMDQEWLLNFFVNFMAVVALISTK
jgi:hypothetical protein